MRVSEWVSEREREIARCNDAHSIVSIFIVVVEFPYSSAIAIALLWRLSTQDNGAIDEEQQQKKNNSQWDRVKILNAIMFSNMEFFAQYKTDTVVWCHGNGNGSGGDCDGFRDGMSGAKKRQIPLICK